MGELKRTHTYALLEVSRAAYDEIKRKLAEAGYDHAFHDGVIDMSGIAVEVTEPAKAPPGGCWVKCPRCRRIGPLFVEEGKVIGNCAQCWLGENIEVPFVACEPPPAAIAKAVSNG